MGLQKHYSVENIVQQLHRALSIAGSPYSDGFNAAQAKQDLYQIKCFLDDRYRELPHFSDEEEWHKSRTFQLLRNSR